MIKIGVLTFLLWFNPSSGFYLYTPGPGEAFHPNNSIDDEKHYFACVEVYNTVHMAPPGFPHYNKRCGEMAYVGGWWCGEANLGAATTSLDPECYWILDGYGECFFGDQNNYEESIVELTRNFISSLGKPKSLQGYDCSQTSDYSKEVYDESATLEIRAEKCFEECFFTAPGYLYTAYYVGVKCGCLKDSDGSRGRLFPVTLRCLHRVVCKEIPEAVCLCGDEKIPKESYKNHQFGPLFKTDSFRCQSKFVELEDIDKRRMFDISDAWENTPSECISTCSHYQPQRPYVALFKRRLCTCEPDPGTRWKVNDENCFFERCESMTWRSGCGGEYTAAIYTLLERVDRKGAKVISGNLNNHVAKTTAPVIEKEEEDEDEPPEEVRYNYVIGFGGLALGVIIVAIIVICCLCKRRSDKKSTGSEEDDKAARREERKRIRMERKAKELAMNQFGDLLGKQ